MGILLLIGIAGCAASLVDGTLGMGFGPTSSTILLSAGIAPAAVSTTVNLAKVATGAAGGAAHWRFGNVDWRLVGHLAGPGCLGAVVGVTVLANVDSDRLRPYLAVLLLVVGVRILLRFSRARPAAAEPQEPELRHASPQVDGFSRRGLGPVAFVGGVTNGLIGAWGPVVTPALLHRDRLEPRVAIGSVNTAEIAVALVASGSLLTSLRGAGVDGRMLAAILIGGLVAAPMAAWMVRHLQPRLLGVAAGWLLLVTNLRELAGWAEVGVARWSTYALVTAVCLLIAVRPRPPVPGAGTAPRPEAIAPRP